MFVTGEFSFVIYIAGNFTYLIMFLCHTLNKNKSALPVFLAPHRLLPSRALPSTFLPATDSLFPFRFDSAFCTSIGGNNPHCPFFFFSLLEEILSFLRATKDNRSGLTEYMSGSKERYSEVSPGAPEAQFEILCYP